MNRAAEALGEPLERLQELPHDAGCRRYARVTRAAGGGTVILVDRSHEPAHEAERFWAVAAVLGAAGVVVPRLMVDVPSAALSVVTDLGPATVGSRLRRGRASPALIRSALAPLLAIGAAGPPALARHYDAMGELRDLVEQPLAGGCTFEDALEHVRARVTELSPVGLVHADYHARNLVVGTGETIGVVDLQDAAMGPVAVDWAAIAYDHNRTPDRSDTAAWEGAAADLLGTLAGGVAVPALRWAGLFWHLRLAGVCARLARQRARFGRELYVVARWLDHLATACELREVAWLPALVARHARLVADASVVQ